MADFATLADKMDAKVDAGLGDSISYKRPADPAPVAIKGFLVFDEPSEGGWAPRDQAAGIVRLKVRRDIIAKPSKDDRITAPLLTGTYRPMGGDPIVTGRYWLVDLQKV